MLSKAILMVLLQLNERNPDKFQPLMSTETAESTNIGEHKMQSSGYEKLLGMEINNQLNFRTPLNSSIKKTNQKVHDSHHAWIS